MEFNRIIKLLRKERGITQKQAAEDLGVSQALLSHYEKGIRECGLDFVVRVADYYNVSCDYLLGRSAERNGMMLSAEDLPNPEKMKDNVYHGSVLPTMNKKLISNNLKKNGGFIPGFRPGKPTADFIRKVLNKVTLFGAIYLGVVAILPLLIGKIVNVAALSIGGTSVIIVVGVALETVQALESQMLMRQYKGFLE